MAEILLTHSNHLYSDEKQTRKMQPYPPLQTLMAAALLRERGYSVAIYDSTFAADPREEFRAALAEHRPRLAAVIEDNFNFLTKMCLTRNRELAFDMCRAAKQAGIATAANGSDATDRSAEYIRAGFDFVIAGELERALLDVAADAIHGVRCCDAPRALGEIVAVSRATGMFPIRNETAETVLRRPPLPDLDALPDPAWDLLDLDPYRVAWRDAHGFFSLNLVSSRGCPYRCNWCAKPIFGSSYRARSPKRVAREMLRLKHDFSVDQIWFADDIFALSASWTRQFAEAVEELGAAVPFKMQSRCDLMRRSTVASLARAGCREVWMGAESGSQKILDAMDKGLRVADIFEARENLRRHGIRACFFLQFGYPGETWEDIQATIRMVREAAPDDIGVSVSYPLPGTKFYARVASDLGEKENWRDSGDLAMMFRGAYSTAFYRELSAALHEAVHGGAPDWSRVEALKESLNTLIAPGSSSLEQSAACHVPACSTR